MERGRLANGKVPLFHNLDVFTTTLPSLILWCSAFFIVQLSHRHMTTGKTIALTRRTFVSKVMSLLFNMLSRLVISFPQRSKSFNFKDAVTLCSDFGAPQNKTSDAISPVFPSIFHEVM